MKKKMMIVAVVLLIVAVAAAVAIRNMPVVETVENEIVAAEVVIEGQTASKDAATETDDEEEAFDVAELYGTVTEVTDKHILLDAQQLGMVQALITDDTLIEGVEEIRVGQVVKVIYDGKMTRSIPAQITAMLIGVYAIGGEVKAVEEGRMTVLRADTQDEVLISLPEGAQVAVGERVTAYTDGAMTMSLPPQMNAVAVVK